MFKSAIMEVELDDGGKHSKMTDGKLKTQHKEWFIWAKQSSKAATEVSWKKRCSYKQLLWKLPLEIFHQNPRKISFKKFVFSKVAQSRSWKFLPKKETGEKHNFHKFLY